MVHSIKPIIIGAKGFIGRHFYRHFLSEHPDLIGTHHTSGEGLLSLNLEKPVLNDIPLKGYQYAIIAAGLCNPRHCATDPAKSYQCNVEGPIQLGKDLLKRGVIPIFFSTDYVFDGSEKSYRPDSPHSPLNEYGKQKAELEKQAVDLDCLVIRLSKVYGINKGDGTLFDEMASTLIQGQSVRAASDQEFAPVWIEDVIKGVTFLMHLQARGIVNLSSQICASRLQMAKKLAQELGVEESCVKEIHLSDLSDSFERPKRLKLESTLPAISWEEGIRKMVGQYAEK